MIKICHILSEISLHFCQQKLSVRQRGKESNWLFEEPCWINSKRTNCFGAKEISRQVSHGTSSTLETLMVLTDIGFVRVEPN